MAYLCFLYFLSNGLIYLLLHPSFLTYSNPPSTVYSAYHGPKQHLYLNINVYNIQKDISTSLFRGFWKVSGKTLNVCTFIEAIADYEAHLSD